MTLLGISCGRGSGLALCGHPAPISLGLFSFFFLYLLFPSEGKITERRRVIIVTKTTKTKDDLQS